MENTTIPDGDAGKAGIPNEKTIVEWVKRDAQAAAYFLRMIVNDPDIQVRLAHALYEKAMQEKKDKELLNEDHG